MELVLFGPPGAGKGTQAERISKEWNVPHISTGDIFRANMREGTPLGQQAQSYVTKGELVPNEIVIAMTLDRLGQEDCASGFLLDGFPRDVEQAGELERWLSDRNRKLTAVLFIELDDEAIIGRLVARRVCQSCGATYNMEICPPKKDMICDRCGGEVVQRPDDLRETIVNRLKVYKEQTAPVRSFYEERGLLLRIPGDGGVEDVFVRIKQAVENLGDAS